MNQSDFPNFWKWQISMTNQDNAIMLVSMLAIAALVWFVIVRWGFKQAMPAFRVAIIGAYFAVLAFTLARGVIH